MPPLPPIGVPPGSGLVDPLLLLTPPVTSPENDLWAAWHEFAKQIGPVARRRFIRATFYRSRFKQIVKL